MKKTMLMTALAAILIATNGSAQFVPGNGNKGHGPGNGSGYQGNGPKDGTGYGAKSCKRQGNVNCDGTGPKSGQQCNHRKGGRR